MRYVTRYVATFSERTREAQKCDHSLLQNKFNARRLHVEADSEANAHTEPHHNLRKTEFQFALEANRQIS
jgi:hypothetical protein